LLELVYDTLNNNNFTTDKAVTLDSHRHHFVWISGGAEAANIWWGGGGFEAAAATGFASMFCQLIFSIFNRFTAILVCLSEYCDDSEV